MSHRSFLSILLGFVFLISPAVGEIEPGTSIKIYILGVTPDVAEKINSIYPVAEDGTVNMPYIGKVRAGGLKAEVFATRVEDAYRTAEIFRQPTIQVIDDRGGEEMKSETVVVGGKVRRTGAVAWHQHLTIYQAIQAAGGADEFGAMNRVLLYREGKTSTYDLRDAEIKQTLVEPNDTIEVPEKGIFGG